MNQNNEYFGENIKKEGNKVNNSQNTTNQKQIAKIKLMEKYNLSEEETEKVLKSLEKKLNKNNKGSLIDEKEMASNYENSENINKNIENNVDEFNNLKLNFQEDESDDMIFQNVLKAENEIDEVISNEMQQKNKISTNEPEHNVDNILSGIIPDYNKHVSIELEKVNLSFEVSNEKVDTFKELFIRTLRRERPRKIKVEALKNVSLKIYKGEKVGIIGYNGAGKSTLLNVITGIFPPDSGCVKTYGNISPLLSLGAGFDYNYSGRKNIFLNGAVLGYDKKFINSKIDEIIEFSELGEYIDIPIKNYSSGMLAKLGFSIATAVNPDILIIDEILAVGDVHFNKKSADKIRSMMDGGTTVLLVSHSIPQIRELCDKAIWIDNGCVREIGEVNKVCNNYLKDAEKASKEQLANISLYQS